MRIGSQRIHLIGIGGAGMSGLARLLVGIGAELTGSDRTANAITDTLALEGFKVWTGSHPERIDGENGYLIRSAAVPLSDPEVRECERRGFTNLLYAEAVGRLSEGKRTLAVAGTHGKTTTTAMTVAALRGAGVEVRAPHGQNKQQQQQQPQRGRQPEEEEVLYLRLASTVVST